ncbi:uroporphyrinogen-III synthase [Brevibacterium sp. UCMA 11754]|uniref:uroporphyrinogen-III synthase n=1 Tax=Brevibacterium sp. UCMA 11754 TaxID=2749198 RepID=UPI001F2AC03A|nr:uroporphyrinogen-III synthase [Brevibacterium sp. UCMA 11754]MCF2570798.1 uroporphyrinogen-III synthase [Brevibacterium sp. UCMA 11754]
MDKSRSDRSGQLAGCRVVLTAQRKAEQFAAALERHDATIVHAPTLSVIPNIDDPELVVRTRALIDARPDVVVVTTGVGFNGWAEVAEAEGLSEQWHAMLSGARIIARGPKARGAIQAAGLTPAWVAESETNSEIQQVLLDEGVRGLRIAVQHHGAGADGLDEAFAAAGAEVSSLVVYRWGPAPDPDAVAAAVGLVADRRCDAVAFTSAPGVTAFLDAARDQGLLQEVLAALADENGVLAAVVGNVTGAPLVEHGITPLIPDRFRLGALVRALVAELTVRKQAKAESRG